MFRCFYIIVAFSFVTQLCLAEQVPLEQLIHGANLNRNQIKNGELTVLTTHNFPESPERFEKRIQARIQEEKEILERLRTRGEEAVEQHLAYIRRYSDVSYLINELNVAFQLFDDNPIGPPQVYQFKLTQIDRREIDDLYDESKDRVKYGGYYRVHTYDGKIEAYESLQLSPSEGIAFSNRHKHAGFSYFYFYGRPQYKITSNATLVGREIIGGVNCDILEYQVNEKKVPSDLLIRVWVDPQKQFCIRKEYIEQKFRHSQQVPVWETVYEDFRQYGEIWFPLTIRETNKKNGKIVYSTTVTVKGAQFNIDFPTDFFEVNPQSYFNRGLGLTPGSEIRTGNLELSLQNKIAKRDKSQTEQDNLLLTCGPNSLLRICELLKINTNFAELAQLSRFDPNQGTTLLGLRDAAKYKGLNPKGIRANLKLLKKNNVPLPAIAYVKGNHFLVFEELVSDGVLISDPANKYDRYLSFKELSEIWSGELLIFDYQPELADPKPMPRVLAEAGVYDFGEALGGSEIKHTFKLKNIGQKPLKIEKVEQSCACTATLASKDEIPPGEFGIVEALLKVPSENRQVEESINVYTNDPVQNRVTLILKGSAFVPITTFPSRLLLGSIQPKTPITKSLTIHQKGRTQVLGVRTDSDHLKATVVSAKVDQITQVEVVLLESTPAGPFSHNLLVDYQYEGKEATHEVIVFGEVLGAFSVFPKRLFFGLVREKQEASKTIAISSVNNQPFKIISVESNSAYVTTKVTPQKDGVGYQLTATVQPDAPAGELSGEILVKTNSTVQPVIRVPLSGIIPSKK